MKRNNIWFTADLHFNHANVLKFQKDSGTRAIANNDIRQHDKIIIDNWQRMVGPDDVVYILGDVFFADSIYAIEVLEQLPGKKHLIYGNHDRVIRNNRAVQSYFDSTQEYLEVIIDSILVCMMHYPIYEWNRMHRGSLHLFGHTHDKVQITGRAMDVGIDTRNDLELWNWIDIKKILLKEPIREHHPKK